MRAVSMECGGLPPLLDWERFADSQAAVPPHRRTPNAQPFRAGLLAMAELPPPKILLILCQNHPGRSQPPQQKEHPTVSFKFAPIQPNPIRLNYIPRIPKTPYLH